MHSINLNDNRQHNSTDFQAQLNSAFHPSGYRQIRVAYRSVWLGCKAGRV